ncbi:MAG: magnesium/cobalt transporter CorA [Atribacteria sp.]|nr:magnesium/cobalt transporter CorA [Candidatus Atribacteria bacterium]MBU1036228.1 magnesium/cobalt transporter CorA [bacterium]MBU1291449.1 magnesium/cobalt transporter CorA [bacterium]MBU4047375.1 magnesium/cobalt transporter CorA [bacterium]
MPKLVKKKLKKVGLPPGTLVHIGNKRIEKVKITIIDYDEKHFQEKEVKSAEECFPYKDKSTITWINIDGVHEIKVIEEIGKHFNLHPLILEDIVDTDQRPKIKDFGNYIFIILKMLYYDEKDNEMKVEQVSLVLGKNYVISFQEREGDVFDAIRERNRNNIGRIRKLGADYLVYSLIDAIVDNYFTIIEKLDEEIENLEDKVIIQPNPSNVQAIHKLKRDLIFLRKSVWPLREVISFLEKGESPLVLESTNIYLRDVYGHTIQVMDTVETLRDIISGILDIYLSSINTRMNEIMKVLTIIATIFIPLTFITGIYGMNFQYMPEIKWFWGYPAVLSIMVAIGIGMLIYFKRKKWR